MMNIVIILLVAASLLGPVAQALENVRHLHLPTPTPGQAIHYSDANLVLLESNQGIFPTGAELVRELPWEILWKRIPPPTPTPSPPTRLPPPPPAPPPTTTATFNPWGKEKSPAQVRYELTPCVLLQSSVLRADKYSM